MKHNPHAFIVQAGLSVSDGTSWIEVLPTAEKAKNGPYYFTVTRADLDAAVAAIEANADRIPVDYDHPDEGDSTRAAGWFTGNAKVIEVGEKTPRGELSDRDSVWAEVKWTPIGARDVESGEYRFVSPEWSFFNRDGKTGLMTKFKQFIAVTLTNRPFFQDLAPVTAGDLDGDEAIKAYATEHKLDPEKFAAAVKDADRETPLEELAAKAKEAPTPKPDPSKEDEMEAEALKALGLNEDASSEEILSAITDLKEKVAITASVDEAVLRELTRVTARELELDRQLARQHRETETERSERDREEKLAKAVEHGQILPVHKDALRAVHAVDPKQFDAILTASPKRSFKEHGTGGAGRDDEQPSPREIHDNRGNVVAKVDDPEWLHNKAVGILAEQGKTMKTASRDEYLAALELASERATR